MHDVLLKVDMVANAIPGVGSWTGVIKSGPGF